MALCHLTAKIPFFISALANEGPYFHRRERSGALPANGKRVTVQERPLFHAIGREHTPPPGNKVIVFTDKLRCLGYIDFDGDWHRESDGMLIKDVVGWSPINYQLTNDSRTAESC